MPETTAYRNPAAVHPPLFPVVGIGASAGGLSALLGLLDHLPQDCGFAIVVVLHLPARDADSVPPILERGTSMPVLKLTTPTVLEPNRIYLVPSRHDVLAEGLSLRAVPATAVPSTQSGAETSIDRFFRALASAYRERAVGIVLSGAGSDGAVGLASIREQGGVTIAQAPEDADHAGMPRAAIASGAVDITLPVNEIAGSLAGLWENSRRIQIAPPSDDAATPEGAGEAAISLEPTSEPANEQALGEIVELLRSRTRHDISHYKRATVLRRLQRRLQVTRRPDLPSYRDYLRDHVAETALLLQDLLISVTSFFRDPDAMASLEHNVLPKLLQGRRAEDSIRVWVVGCATGEEAYSIAILLHELVAGAAQPAIQIFATDIDERAIAVARNGLYPGAIAGDVTTSRLRTFFVPEEDSFRVGKRLRESVLFASHNILHDAPFSRLDLVLCRNLLIYLDRHAQSAILETFRHVLKPGGHLFLGTAETADAAAGAFKPIDARSRIYGVVAQRRERQGFRRLLPPSGRALVKETAAALTPQGRPPLAPAPLLARTGPERLHQQLLVESAPASVLVDSELNILHTTPGAAEFMVHAAGAPSRSLMSNVHPDLRLELRAAILSAGETGRKLRVRQIPVTWQRGTVQEQGGVDIRVCPARDPDSGAGLSVILFEAVALPLVDTGSDTNGATGPHISDLQAENQRLKDQLHQTIARFDQSTEELQAANAELAAINDALGRATEELETKKEELQSMNEELIAVNQELKAKVDESGQISDDFQNLSACGPVIALFLDRGLNVKRFTPAAAGFFGLGAGGPSRTLDDIAEQLSHASLSADAAQALRTLQPIERLVQSNDGRSFVARIQPYRTTRDSIEGAVFNLSDVTLLQQTRRELLDAQDVLRVASDASQNHALIVLDAEGRISSWNPGAKRVFGYDENDIVGQSFVILADAVERSSGTPQEALRTARERGSVSGEQSYRRKDGSTFRGTYVRTALGRPIQGFVETVHDLSPEQEARSAYDQLLARERALTQRHNLSRRAQDELFDVLASELKRPLSLIQVNADMLVRLPETRGIPVAGKVAESIGKAVVNQSHIIDGLRDLALSRSGRLTLQMRPASLRDLVETEVNARKEQASAKSLSLEFLSDGDPLTALCDPARIQQVVRNLLGNAIKFTEHGGVTVRAAREGEQALLTVSDTGIGIPLDLLETIFEAYELPSTTMPRPKRGPGIGLALVKELVSAHDGKVVADSEGTERGATFTIRLPLATPATAESAPAEAGPPAAADDGNPLRGLRVVLVDDSVDLLTSFGALMTLEGATVDCFENAEAALARLLRGDVDLLISDLGMPGMNGYELISEVRKQPKLAALPAIALTGYGRTRDPGHAVRSGFNAHTTKPATVEELKNIVGLLQSL